MDGAGVHGHARLQDELATTTIYVTHDQVEAMTMGDRVAVMRKGELQQVAPPQELYDGPVNLFVGGFIGSPAMNMVEGALERSNGGMSVQIGDQRIELGEGCLRNRPALGRYAGRSVIVGIRPEDLEDAALEVEAPEHRTLRGKVVLREALGAEIMVHFTMPAKPAQTEDVRELVRDLGDERAMREVEQEQREATMIGRFDPRTGVREGEAATVAVNAGAIHFFDPETGLGIYDLQDGGG